MSLYHEARVLFSNKGKVMSAKQHSTMRQVSIFRVNVVTQGRQTFERREQKELTENIAAKGVLNPPILACFEKSGLESYLYIVNKLWKRSFGNAEMKFSIVGGKRRYYVLLAGERRMRSYRELVEKGVHQRFMRFTVHEGIDPLDAMGIQFSENSHRRVPPNEDAHAIAEYKDFLEVDGKSLSLAAFARGIGRSPEAVKSALLFVSLPAVIRHAVAGQWGNAVPNGKLFKRERLRLPYGIAVELARRQKNGESEKALIEQMCAAVIGKTKVEDFRQATNHLIENKGQSLFSLMSQEADTEAGRRFRRRTIEASVSRMLAAEEIWLAKVLSLFQSGILGSADSPFALGSVKSRLLRLAELYQSVFQHSYRRPSPQALERLAHVRELQAAIGAD